jgi:cytochrome c-type biogenesis protein CcmH
MTRWLWCVLLALAFVSGVASAQAIDPLPFKDRVEEVRFQHLTEQLRCMVCQNESLADSNAELARDLRHEVFTLMQSGKSDTQIKHYLTQRYSDFVLYDPPLRRGTLLLWLGPILMLLLTAAALIGTDRGRLKSDTQARQEEPW